MGGVARRLVFRHIFRCLVISRRKGGSSVTFGQAFMFAHRQSWTFLLTFPVIAAIPILAEFAQHVVEMQVGMYAGPDGMRAAEADPSRMAFGFAKTLALGLIAYWALRFYASRDPRWTRRLEPRAVRLFALVFALQTLLTALGLFAFSGSVAVGFFVFTLVFTPLLARFVAAAPLGVWISPPTSIRQIAPQLPWAFAFNVIAILPLMALHYALGIGAVFVPGEAAKWAMLVLDALVVGWLAALMAAITWVMAIRKDPPAELVTPIIT